uniref:beta strand repeat-containing protein n=1 Tax=Microbacterium sp. TaxID=51671 RepID=UPI0032217262
NAGNASTANGGAGTGAATTPSAESAQGKVNAAAAVAVTLSTVRAETILGPAITVTTTGAAALNTSANTDAASSANGSASQGATATIGAAVAITLANVTNRAVVPAGVTIRAGSLAASATVTADGADTTATFGAESIAGAGGGKVSVAGSFALAVVNHTTTAGIDGTVVLTGGDATLTATSDVATTVKALPAGAGVTTAGQLGLGASVALALVTDTTAATIGDNVSLTGARNLALTATATDVATAEARMGAKGGKVALSPAVGIALSNITTLTRVGSGGTLALSGGLTATATQRATATSTANAAVLDAATAGVGVGLALTIANHTVTSALARSLTAGGDVALRASSVSDATSTATASAAGAPENAADSGDAGNPGGAGGAGVDDLVAGERAHAGAASEANGGAGTGSATTPSAESSQGKVNVAAAVAITLSTVRAETILGPAITVSTPGSVTLATSANTDASSSANGSASQGATATIGAAVAITLGNVVNRAVVPTGVTVSAGSLTASATVTADGADTTATFGAESIAGAGGGKVSVAGSFALAVVNHTTTAGIDGTVTLAGGDATITATSDVATTVKALPAGAGVTSTGQLGLGASVALALVTDTTTATIGDNVSLTGARDLILTATATDAASAEARMGAKGGKVALSPAVAITLSNVTTTTRIGSGGVLGLARNLTATATQKATAGTTASAAVLDAATAGVGVGLALTIANHTATTTLARNLTAAAVSLRASSISDATSVANASAAGAPENADDSGDPGNPGGASGPGVDDLVAGERAHAGAASQANGGAGTGSATTPSAASSQGKVNVAAAVAITLATVRAETVIDPAVTSIAVTGAVTLATSANTDASSSANGSASQGATATIGAAVAITLANVVNRATVPVTLTVSARDLTVSATVTADGADTTATFGAASIAGAGGGKVSVAGSFALAIVNHDTNATIDGTVVLAGGDATVTAASAVASTVTALPAGEGVTATGQLGLGASVALNLITDTTRADVADGVSVTGARNVTLTATATDAATTEARMGAKGGKVALAPAVAITLSNVTTATRIGTGVLQVSGTLTMAATQKATVATTSTAAVLDAATAGIGVGLALTIANHTVTSTLARNTTAGGAVALSAAGVSGSSAGAAASAAGAPENTADSGDPGNPGGGSGDGVNQLAQGERDFADSTATANGGTGSGGQAAPEAETSSGPVNVAAAIGITIATVRAETIITPAVTAIVAGTSVTLSAGANTDATSSADGSAAGSGSATIGAGVALTLANVTNRATVPATLTVTAHDLTVAALVQPDGADTTATFGAASTSGAGGGKISVAGSFALAVVNHTTLAAVYGTVILTGGDATLTATSAVASTVTALPVGEGVSASGDAGIGASVALNLITDTTRAEIADGVSLTGARTVTLTATATDAATTEARMGAKGGGVALAPAVAITISNVTTQTRLGTGVLQLAGDLAMTATQTASADTTAASITLDATDAAIGVALALTIANHGATSTLARNTTAGGSVSLRAASISSSSALATASAAGAPENSGSGGTAGNGVDSLAQGERDNADSVATANGGAGSGTKQNPSASTSGGAVAVAAAVGIVVATIVAETVIDPAVSAITAANAVTLASSANTDARSGGDGSSAATGDATVGAGVALTLATVTNRATVPATLTVSAHDLTVSATVTPNGSDTTAGYGAAAAAGAAGGNVSVAGAVAIAILLTDTLAAIYGTVVLTGGDVAVTAASAVTSTVTALPVGDGASGTGDAGVGAAFALTLDTHTTTALVADEVSLTGARNVTLTATATDATTTEARMGAKGGGVAVAPAIAIVISAVTTLARIGTGVLEAAGSVSITARQHAAATTQATAAAIASTDAAVGVSLALTIADHTVTAVLGRDTTAAGDVSLTASSWSASSALATASAAGAPENDQDAGSGDPATEGGAAGTGVDQLVGGQRGYADSTATSYGAQPSGSTSTPSAKTSSGPVNVAAAIGIDIATVRAEALVEPQVDSIVAGGTFTLASSVNTDASSGGDGSSSKGGDAAIGAGIAITYNSTVNRAVVPATLTVAAHALSVSATQTVDGADDTSTVRAISSSGAGGGKISVAGSVALAISTFDTLAAVSGTVTLTGGDASIVAGSKVATTVKALPAGEGVVATGDAGVGASFALALATNTTIARIDDDVELTGARDLTVAAGTIDETTTEASMGAKGGKVTVTPAIALTVSTVTTRATIGALASGPLEATGRVLVSASQTAAARTTAGAVATGATDAAIGVALALNFAFDTVEATTRRSITAGGEIRFQASGSSLNGASASASASGAPGESSGDAPAGGVDGQLSSQRTYANQQSLDTGGAGVQNSSNPSASTSDGGVSVAAAIALNIADVSARAWLPDGLTLIAGGAVLLLASEQVDGIVQADGTALATKDAGVGAAVALNLVFLENRAWAGADTTVQANGFTASATMTAVGSDRSHDFSAIANAGAGSPDVGVAGAVALNIVTDRTEAWIPSSAVVDFGTGDVVVAAENLRTDTAKAKADAKGGGSSTGVGASVAINVIAVNLTRAEIEDGADVTGGANVWVTADATDTVIAEVTAGSSGGNAVSPAVGINVVLPVTLARIGTPGPRPFVASGDIVVRGTYKGSATVTGNADAAGASVAVGAIIVINVVDIDPIAAVYRDITGASLWLIATTELHTRAEATASAQGTKSSTQGGAQNSDAQAQDQLSGTPATSGTTGSLPSASSNVSSANGQANSQSGQSSDGVGVGAAVTVNWVTVENEAIVAPGLVITLTGALAVLATNETDAVAKAIGTSYSLETSSSNIGAAVGLNVVTVTNRGSIGAGATITAGSVSITGITPTGARNDFQTWAISAAGGRGDASVAGSVGVQVLQLVNEAVIGEGSSLTVTGNVGLDASNPMGLQTLAVSGAFTTSGTGVGAAIVVQYVDATTRAHIDSSFERPTTIDAGGSIIGRATASLVPLAAPEVPLITLPAFTAVALGAAAAGGDAAVGGSVIVDVMNRTTQAFLGDAARVNQNVAVVAAQDLAFTASDQSELVELAGALGLTTGSAGVGFALIVGVHNKDVRAFVGRGVVADLGGSVWLTATAGEGFTEIVAGGAAASTAGVTGSFTVLVVNEGDSDPGTRAYIDGGPETPSTVRARGSVTIAASDPVTMVLFAGGVGVGSTAGIGVASVVFVRTGVVDAYVAAGDTVWARGGTGLTVTASQSEDQWLVAVAGTVGGTAAVSGAVTIGVQNNTTTAHLDRGVTVDGVGSDGWPSAMLAASDHTTLRSVAGQLAVGGTAGVGAGADVQVVNKDTQAWIAPQSLVVVSGDVAVDATSSEDVTSVSAGGSVAGTAAIAVNAAVSVYDITTKAFIGEICSAGTASTATCPTSRAIVVAGGSARVAANEVLAMDIISGSVAVSGTASVGVTAAVPILTKTTTAFVGDLSQVTALGGGSGLVSTTGGYDTQYIDTRFTPATAIQGDGITLDLGYAHGLAEGQQVSYDPGGMDEIGGLDAGAEYYVHVVSPTRVQLSATQGGAPIVLGAPARGGRSQRIYPTDQATVPVRSAPYLTPALDVSGNTVTLPYDLALDAGDAVVYTANGGTPIGGLVDGQTYYVIPVGPHAFQLSATPCGATPSADGCSGGATQPIALSAGTATGRAHSFVLEGTQPPGDPAQITGIRIVTPRTDRIWGVAVIANNSDEILAIGASAAVSATAGVGVGGNVNVVTADTDAYIGRLARVNDDNTGASPLQSVRVVAGSDFRQLMVSAAVGGGMAGVATSATVDIVTLTTDAVIDDGAIVRAARDIVVVATGAESITAAAAAVGAGVAGVAAAVATIVLDVHTYARTGRVVIDAGNNVLVAASDDTSLTTVSGGIGVGFVGVGAGVAVVSATKDTRALIGAGSTVDARALQPASPLDGIPNGTVTATSFPTSPQSGLAVLASSSQTVFGMAVSAAGGFVGVAGAVNVTLVRGTTIARIDSTSAQRTVVNGDDGAGSAQSVSVVATDRTDALTIGGGLGGGFVGVAGGVDIGVMDLTVRAEVGDGAVITASRDLAIRAMSIRTIRSYAVSIAGGVVGVSGSVSVWTAGGSPSAGYDTGGGQQDPLNGGAPQSAAGGHASGGGADGYTHILDGAQRSSGDRAGQRINPTLDAATAAISSATPDSDLVSREFSQPPTPGGTTSAIGIGATITTGRHVEVTAEARDTFFALAGSASGGLAALGVAVVVANLDSIVDAGIARDTVVRAGGDVGVRATHNEDTSAVAFSGGIGAGVIAGQVVVLNSDARQNAHLDDGAAVPVAGGTVSAAAAAGRRVAPLTLGVQLGGLAAGASVAVADVTGDTLAHVGVVTIGAESAAGGLAVSAQSTI